MFKISSKEYLAILIPERLGMVRAVAINPPVEVPAIRSKLCQIGFPVSSSTFFKMVKGTTPLNPPPSMLKILNFVMTEFLNDCFLKNDTQCLCKRDHDPSNYCA